MITALVLLGLSIASVWFPAVCRHGGFELPLWVVLFVAATIAAFMSGMVDGRGSRLWAYSRGRAGFRATAWMPYVDKSPLQVQLVLRFFSASGFCRDSEVGWASRASGSAPTPR